jgi:hypothetical protein
MRCKLFRILLKIVHEIIMVYLRMVKVFKAKMMELQTIICQRIEIITKFC